MCVFLCLQIVFLSCSLPPLLSLCLAVYIWRSHRTVSFSLPHSLHFYFSLLFPLLASSVSMCASETVLIHAPGLPCPLRRPYPCLHLPQIRRPHHPPGHRQDTRLPDTTKFLQATSQYCRPLKQGRTEWTEKTAEPNPIPNGSAKQQALQGSNSYSEKKNYKEEMRTVSHRGETA